MTREDIIRMAREAGAGEPESLYGRTDYVVLTRFDLERFAKGAYAAGVVDEREACAKVCEEIANKPSNMVLGVALDCAAAIRARGQP